MKAVPTRLREFRHGALALAALLLGPAAASAVPIQFRYEAVLDSVSTELSGKFSPGQTWTGTYTFDSTSP